MGSQRIICISGDNNFLKILNNYTIQNNNQNDNSDTVINYHRQCH